MPLDHGTTYGSVKKRCSLTTQKLQPSNDDRGLWWWRRYGFRPSSAWRRKPAEPVLDRLVFGRELFLVAHVRSLSAWTIWPLNLRQLLMVRGFLGPM